jgi:mono/diheme cytochrome c family protein
MASLELLLLTLATSASCSLEDIDFERDVRPLLAARCFECHGSERQKSSLRLDRRSSALRGGDSGEPAFVPGKSANSRLIELVSGADPLSVMPPTGTRLSEIEVALLTRWIDEGADYGDESAEPPEAVRWSLRPLVRPEVPASARPGWEHPIDRFVLAGLDAAGLEPSAEAARATLIRRMSLIVCGLPPTPDDVRAFVEDPRPDAYEQLVERLLDSRAYGERWARHWLDLARFAETDGFETNTPRPNAWRYRDYVVQAFNDDTPYDQFVLEQLAGDAVGVDVATGFLVGGPYDTVLSPDVGLTRQQRQDELADMVNVTTTAFLGLTVACARCHDHKFDPITQTDYYAMQAIFSGVRHGERPLPPTGAAAPVLRDEEAERQRAGLRAAVSPLSNEETFTPVAATHVRFRVLRTNSGSEPCLDELEVFADGVNIAPRAMCTTSSDYAGDPKHQSQHLNDGVYGNGRSWISDTPGSGWALLELAEPARIDRIVWGRDREGVYGDRLATEYVIEVGDVAGIWTTVVRSDDRVPFRDEAAELAKLPRAYAGRFEEPAPTHRLYRGDPMAEREVVAPDVPQVFGSLALTSDTPERERRVALARWLCAPRNPLTARVIVNRIWMHHFGEGLVDTPSDFGAMGNEPSHPELLDWLAVELIDSDWSLKHVQRLIVSSRTWRQVSWPNDAGLAQDASARRLWRFPPRRMEAEVLRDTILAVTGTLDTEAGGPGFSTFEPNDNYVRVYTPKDELGPDTWRRMIYMTKVRMERDDIFGVFDTPDAGQVCPERARSTTALQALNLFNSGFVLDQARRFAARLERDAGSEMTAQIERAFALAFGRAPESEELAAAFELVREHGLPALCRAIFNANELAFVQ